ncbi:MFS transporter [Georgenia halophila]|uniref:MFS transporter n=1 Tax=Georgenia halophila TaxID=620889 RepID=A0ABP8LBE0_9MICO
MSAGAGGAGRLTALLAVTFLAFVNYAAMLPVVPMWASVAGAASLSVGMTTGSMMAATVLTQLTAPWLFRLLRLRPMMILGAVLLAVPTPAYLLSGDMSWILTITVVRGVGFALVVMAGATLVADLAGPGRLSSSASLYGAAAALPNLGALAGGVWVAQTWGFPVVFWVAGVAALLAAACARALPGTARGAFALAALADLRRVVAPVGLFLLTAAAFGAATTFLPLAGPGAAEASVALLVASVALLLGRLGSGVVGDRVRAGRMLVPTVLLAAAGLATLAAALRLSPALLPVGAAMLGAGFGACQNDSFVTTVQRLGPTRTAPASTVWNAAYDGGLGLGAVVLGWVIGGAGYGSAFLVMALSITGLALTIRLAGSRRSQR